MTERTRPADVLYGGAPQKPGPTDDGNDWVDLPGGGSVQRVVRVNGYVFTRGGAPTRSARPADAFYGKRRD